MLCSAHLIPPVTGRRWLIELRVGVKEKSKIKGDNALTHVLFSRSDIPGILTSMYSISGPYHVLSFRRIDCNIFVQDPHIEFHV